MNRSDRLLQLLNESAPPVGVSLKNATYWDVKETNEDTSLRLTVYGNSILKASRNKSTGEVKIEVSEGVDLQAFADELKKRLEG